MSDIETGGKSGGGGASRLPRDEFVSRLVSDASALEEQEPVIMMGYLGDSDEEGFTRVYGEPTLSEYTDVRDEDVLHVQPVCGPEQGGLGGHMLWVRKDARVAHGGRGQQKQKGTFFDGPITQGRLGGPQGGAGSGAGGGAAGGPVQITLLTHAGCGPGPVLPGTAATVCTQVHCPPPPTHPIGCTGYYGCGHQTAATVCTQIHCPQPQTPYCPSFGFTCTAINCPAPSAYDACPTGFCVPQQQGAAAAGPVSAHCAMSYGPCPPQGHAQTAFLTLICPTFPNAGCLPVSMGCPPQGGAQAAGPVSAHCAMSYGPCPPHTSALGCPRTSDCPPTYMPGCPNTSTCTPGGGGQGAEAATGFGCPRTIDCTPTYRPGCPNTSTCTPRTLDCPRY